MYIFWHFAHWFLLQRSTVCLILPSSLPLPMHPKLRLKMRKVKLQVWIPIFEYFPGFQNLFSLWWIILILTPKPDFRNYRFFPISIFQVYPNFTILKCSEFTQFLNFFRVFGLSDFRILSIYWILSNFCTNLRYF